MARLSLVLPVMSSPRPWGCFLVSVCQAVDCCVFPTSVGVFLGQVPPQQFSQSLPHVRGGVSARSGCCHCSLKSSPRPWGCFLMVPSKSRKSTVFPTSVGVFLGCSAARRDGRCLPHVRGGVSSQEPFTFLPERSSPRPWGCFPHPVASSCSATVFPTSVGVFPRAPQTRAPLSGLPHVRGGVSSHVPVWSINCMSSPRPWGCFRSWRRPVCSAIVFPTSVGVFRLGRHSHPLH